MERIGGIIFDLDGTLLDTLADLAASVNHVLRQLNLPEHPTNAYRTMVGDGAATLLTRAMPDDMHDRLADALAMFHDHYTAHALDTTQPYPGISELLAELAGRGMPIAINTNKPQQATDRVVEQLLGGWPWSAVHGARPDPPKKPDPTAALHIADRWNLPPQRVVFLGDSNVDMQTATAAGMVGIGAGWGFRTAAELREHGASIVLDHPLELLAHLG